MKRDCQVCSTSKHILLHFGKGGELPEMPEQQSKALIEMYVHKSMFGEKFVKTIEKMEVVKELAALLTVAPKSPPILDPTKPVQWVPSVGALEEWIAIDLGHRGFPRMAATR